MSRFFHLAALTLILLCLVTMAVRAAGNEVVGFYRVEQTTDLGSQVRVTLHIRLVNNTAQELAITKVALHDMQQRGGQAEVAAWARLEPRGATSVDNEFVISRAEYASWNRGVHPSLQVAFQPAGGREVVRTVALRPLPARRPK